MKKIKVNADLYVGEDKLATKREITDAINKYNTENPPYNDTEIRDKINNVSDKFITTGDGDEFLSNDGTYKRMGSEQINEVINEAIEAGKISNYDDTEVKNELNKINSDFYDISPNLLNLDDPDLQINKRFASVTSGYIMESEGHVISGKIPCKSGDVIRVKLQNQMTYLRTIAWYNSSDSRIGMYDLSTDGNFGGEGTVPENTSYCKVCFFDVIILKQRVIGGIK